MFSVEFIIICGNLSDVLIFCLVLILLRSRNSENVYLD